MDSESCSVCSTETSVPRISSTSQTTIGQDGKIVSSNAARSNGRHQPVADAVVIEKTSMTESREHPNMYLAFALSSSGTKTTDSRQGQNVEEGVSQHVDSDPSTPSDDDTTRRGSPLTILTRVTALVILAIIMVGLFSLPLTLFVVKTTNSDSESKAAGSSGCTAEVYTGEICQSVLAASQSCIPGREDSTEVFIQSIASIPQELVEQQLIELLQFVTPSPECEGELLSFLCVEAFSGFCNSNGTVHRTSRPDCERITTTVCAAEFLQLLPLLEARGADLSCDTFPASSTICNYVPLEGEETGINQTAPITGVGGTTVTATERNCSEGFFMDETTDFICTPECGEWWPQPHSQQKVMDIVTLTSGAVGVTLSLIVVFLSCVHYKTAFTFPGIFVFYQMLSSMLYGIIFLSTYIDFKGLLCESRNLVESVMPGNETPLCILSAASWIYVSHQVALWWIFYLSMVFCAVFWPFKYHYWKRSGYFKYFHLVMVSAGIVLPIIPVIICLKVDGYVLYFLVRPDCVARNAQAAFYSHVVPLIAAVVLGLYLLILILWKFFSEEWICPKRQGFTKRQVEFKILFIFCCYLLVWSDAIGVIVATLIEAEDYRNTVIEYFTCEAVGTEECQRDVFERFDTASKVIATSLIGLYPAIFLIYFVRVKRSSLLCIKSSTVSSSSTSRNV